MDKKIKERKFNSDKKKRILLILQAGIALSLNNTPKKQSFVFKQLKKEWRNINKQYLYRVIREFKYERLVDWKENKDGSVQIVLTEKGRKYALKFNFETMEIKKPAVWDGKWRLVLYDIPEKRKNAREALRRKLKNLGFYELQKSVFVYPFPCRNEINFIAEFFEVRNNIYFGEITELQNDSKLKIHFNLY